MRASRREGLRYLGLFIFVACALGVSATWAGPREQAKRIHDRLVGVPPAPAALDSMEAKVASGDAVGAAMDAMDNPAFYNTTVREFATLWFNREQSVYGDLNDSTATVIGMIRDDVPFDQVLYGDIVYVGSTGVSNVPYSQTDNEHYESLQADRVDLSDPANLVQEQQSMQPGSPIGPAEAGDQLGHVAVEVLHLHQAVVIIVGHHLVAPAANVLVPASDPWLLGSVVDCHQLSPRMRLVTMLTLQS